MEIHYTINSTMDSMADRYFLPSIPECLFPIPHRSEVVSSGNFAQDGYFDVLVDKVEWILTVIEGRLDDELMLWSDVDIVFNRGCDAGSLTKEIEALANGKDLLFQREWSEGSACNAGVQVIRRNTRTLV